MPADIKDELLAEGGTSEELAEFLRWQYTSGSQPTSNTVCYGDEIILEYYGSSNRSHSRKEIKCVYFKQVENSGKLPTLVQQYRAAIRSEDVVAQRAFFSGLPVTGFYRSGDDFQILKIPDSAPRPKELSAEHPFILEVAYKKAEHLPISQVRMTRAFNEVSLPLNAFVYPGISAGPRTFRKNWALIPESGNPSALRSEYLQQGYHFKDSCPRIRDRKGFSEPGALGRIPLMGHADYFSQLGISHGKPFELPDCIEQLFATYRAMNEDHREMFLRASYWHGVASEAFPISESLAYLSFVSAIESLIPDPSNEGACPSCGRDKKKGLTQLFHECIEEYAPGMNSAARSALYAVRSKLTHGKTVFHGDMHEYGFTPASSDERNKYWTLSMVVRGVLINWLIGHTQGT